MKTEDAQQLISAEIRDAIKTATPRAVHPDDEFGSPEPGSVRIAGWDPEETRSNEALLKRCCARLVEQGWQVFPDAMTDSEDRSALAIRTGVTLGRLTAADQGLTFIGDLTLGG
ncbi:hypothetical protein [Streptomyces sp. SCSIO ZS0520]|uniref:hypothetical protein n=1 Tax=Streptomyces sp. SCSIO ZS0520 TaxID=2892996 RepID=UPI0021DB2DE8|nr:hypothetical protein [Streptomyces sp. SCSIO ZS0520]